MLYIQVFGYLRYICIGIYSTDLYKCEFKYFPINKIDFISIFHFKLFLSFSDFKAKSLKSLTFFSRRYS